MSNATDVNAFIEELNGGVFQEKLAHVLSEVANGTILFGEGKKKGEVCIAMKLERVGDNSQVIIEHKLMHTRPTKRGKVSEEDTTSTPMFVGKGGKMSITQPREDVNGKTPLFGDESNVHTLDNSQEQG